MERLEKNFADWENHVFGFGYGSGEQYILTALKKFMSLCPAEGPYDYADIEAALTPTVAWMLINTFGHADLIEYGSSTRYAWLTPQGVALKAFVDSHTVHEMLMLTGRDDVAICYPDACNCGPNGYDKDRVCDNPFWRARPHPEGKG